MSYTHISSITLYKTQFYNLLSIIIIQNLAVVFLIRKSYTFYQNNGKNVSSACLEIIVYIKICLQSLPNKIMNYRTSPFKSKQIAVIAEAINKTVEDL